MGGENLERMIKDISKNIERIADALERLCTQEDIQDETINNYADNYSSETKPTIKKSLGIFED
jgi:hypothetical protein